MKNSKCTNLKKSCTPCWADGQLKRIVFLVLYYFEFIFSFLLYFVPFSGIILQVIKFKVIAPTSKVHEYIYYQLQFLYIKLEPVKFISRFAADIALKMLLSYNTQEYDIYQHLSIEQCEQFKTFLKLETRKIKKFEGRHRKKEQKIQSRIHNNPMLSRSTIM